MHWQTYDLPFFEERHKDTGSALRTWRCPVDPALESLDLEGDSRAIAKSLAHAGLLDIVVPHAHDAGGVDVRALCMAREYLGYHHILSDTIFAMQGIGTAPIWMHGTPEQQEKYLTPARRGDAIAAFALSEPDTGSDVASMKTTARLEGDEYILNGNKAWISNAGIADHYVVVARTGEAPGARGLSAFIVDADTEGLQAHDPIKLIAPHPLANLSFKNCRIPAANLIGERGNGFKIAMGTFNIFRASVGAAGVGVARRALDACLERVSSRQIFGRTMSEIEGVQTKLADMTTDIETAMLVVYRAAWHKDTQEGRGAREASMAKLVGSEAAFRVVDAAVQLFGGRGVEQGCIIEQLYREVRPMRIYEGASEIQKLIIARDVLGQYAHASRQPG